MNTKGLAFALGAFVALAGWEARAGQLVVMDETWVHAPDLADSHYRVTPMMGVPDDWTSPVDWTQGSVWVHLEVLTKPTAQETKFQVCFEANPTYACTLQSPTYTEVGVYEWESTFAQFWSPPNEFVDWKQGVNKFACILKDTMNGKPSADNVGPETAALYMPTEVRMVITLVEPGSTYEPPAPVGEETTGGEETTTGETTDAPGTSTDDTGGESTTAEATSTGLPATTAETSTGEPETTTSTGGEAPTTGAGTTGDAASTSTSAGASDGASTSDGAQDGSEAGCGCRGGGEGPGGAGLLLAALAWRRRRR
ncbi:MYXO-CTERM sorting domain-containing protein [Nannocystis sp. RBIL2]|uniref:MYXO-CTERM sorting domain-containing protein n=1 Tax=Nannocystis sp. RBIL2 TaxID=2996788 RepID=UPI002271734C|nr:MYXO-CTERM sorting domain-containing protein [Nannocystis sp. RBIL2]MCY1066066.1 MYXO-CTERM sorting domain-containing protein [Nannocystis sp. RBIL2]